MVAALLAALLWTIAAGSRELPGPPYPQATDRITRPSPTAPSPVLTSARKAARPFVRAFLSYETGGAGAAVRRSIRAGADRSFARELLSRPPRPAPTGPGPAPIAVLRVSRLPSRADLALVSGMARRRSATESFAFLFARRRGRWLAIAPAE